MSAIILNPTRYIFSTKKALYIYAWSVLPSLFPFMFFTKILTSTGIANSMSKHIGKPVASIYNVPNIASYIQLMSIVSGYPVGASLIADMYDMGMIDSNDARRIMTFTSSAGPLFVVGTVGGIMMHSDKYGYIILLSVVMGSILNGIIYRGKKTRINSAITKFSPLNKDFALNDAMIASIKNILLVGGYIVIFYLIADILYNIGAVSLVTNIICYVLKYLSIEPKTIEGICLSLIEMTKGIPIIVQNCPNNLIVPIIAGVVSFGGLSITMQSMAFLARAKIKVSHYILAKLTQSIIATCVASILVSIII